MRRHGFINQQIREARLHAQAEFSFDPVPTRLRGEVAFPRVAGRFPHRLMRDHMRRRFKAQVFLQRVLAKTCDAVHDGRAEADGRLVGLFVAERGGYAFLAVIKKTSSSGHGHGALKICMNAFGAVR